MKRLNPEQSTDDHRGVARDTLALLRIADALEELRDIQLIKVGIDVLREQSIQATRQRVDSFFEERDG